MKHLQKFLLTKTVLKQALFSIENLNQSNFCPCLWSWRTEAPFPMEEHSQCCSERMKIFFVEKPQSHFSEEKQNLWKGKSPVVTDKSLSLSYQKRKKLRAKIFPRNRKGIISTNILWLFFQVFVVLWYQLHVIVSDQIWQCSLKTLSSPWFLSLVSSPNAFLLAFDTCLISF